MPVSAPIQQKLTEVSGITSKLLRKSFGRGPDSCIAFANHHFLVFYIRGFMSPMETILLEHGNTSHIHLSRNIVMRNVLESLQGILEHLFNEEIQDFYHDWNFDNNSGMISVVFKNNITASYENIETFPERDDLIKEINRISISVQKLPEKTDVYRISHKLYIAKRKGILIPIEKALISKGYQQILLDTMYEMEKSQFKIDGSFKDIFKQSIMDIFIDWKLKEDKSIICFVL